MLQYNFKDVYYNQNNDDIERYYTTTFYSPTNVGGTGIRTAPYRSNTALSGWTASGSRALILSSGNHGTQSSSTPVNFTKIVSGQGIGNTIWSPDLYISGAKTGTDLIYFRDITFGESLLSASAPNNAYRINTYFLNCEIAGQFKFAQGTFNGWPITFTRCIIKVYPTATVGVNQTALNFTNNNSFVSLSTPILIGSLGSQLYTHEKCDIDVNQTSLTTYKNSWYSFDNCNYKIGTETTYTPLSDGTPDEQRVEFINRCVAAGLTLPAETTEFGLTSALPRWVFTKNQVFEGTTWEGSDINIFEVPRNIKFGWNNNRGKKVSVTNDSSLANAIAPSAPNSGSLVYANDSLSIDESIDVSEREVLYAESNIIWLGSKRSLSRIDRPNDFPYQFGVLIDSIPNVLFNPVTTIEPNEIYLVRSNDEFEASVKYNNIVYSSSLTTKTYIFKGVANIDAFDVNTGNPVVYKINDILNYQSIEMRIVNKIPSDIITSGTLSMNYWYYVEHNTDQTNTTDYISCGGQDYFVGSSFLISNSDMASGFDVTGNVHLRRCWHKDFDWNTSTGVGSDSSFWQNEQKPDWFDVLPEDTRCLMLKNHIQSVEMQRGEDGKYIATGHPDYYNMVLGQNGVLWPNNQYVSGTYMQLRVTISTVNPM